MAAKNDLAALKAAKAWTATGITFLLLGSGCVDPDSSPAARDVSGAQLAPGVEAEFTDETGGVAGLVVDEEVKPVENVEVTIFTSSQEQRTVSNAAGEFSFSRLEPATYSLSAAKLGFETKNETLDVMAAQLTRLNVIMVAIPGQIPYLELIIRKSLIPCSVSLTGGGPCGYTPVTGNIQPVADNFDEEGSRWHHFWSGSGVMSVFLAMQWPQQTAAGSLSINMILSHAGRTTAHSFCSRTSTSPNEQHWERDPANHSLEAPEGKCVTAGATQRLPEGEPKTIPLEGITLRISMNGSGTVPPGTTTSIPVSVIWQQPYDLYFALFHWAEAPLDYSPLVDG